MTIFKSFGEQSGLRGDVERSDYLIDRFRVRYAFGGGWACGCADFLARGACKHTREAAGRRTAQEQISAHLSDGSRDSFSFRMRAHRR